MRAGIDLGTTFSLAAWLDAGAPALIPDCSEPRVFRTPSVVHLSGGSALVGGRAEELLEEDPRVPLIRFFKRRLGQCRPVFHDDGAAAWSAEGVSALLLRKLAFDAEVHSGSPLQQAVIAVPAHFTDPQRRALLGAASLADLDVLGLVEAPVAAALHYGAARDMSDEVVLVYDFGGGGFDTTVLTMDPHGVHTLGKTGLADVGGKELDEQVADRVLSELERVPGRSFPKDAEALAHLRRIAEEFKIELCASGRSRVRRTVEWDGRAVEVEIARADFESAIRDLVSRTEAEALACLWDTGLRPRDVTRVLLVGGCSQIPLVEQRLRGLFGGAGQEVLRHEPIRAVAYGAAMHAGQLAGEADRHGLPPVLGGVTAHGVGIHTLDAATTSVGIDVLVKRNTPLPVRVTATYFTSRPYQERLLLDVVQFRQPGEPAVALGRLTIGPFDAPLPCSPVRVTVECRRDGTIALEAHDVCGRILPQTMARPWEQGAACLDAQRSLVRSTIINDRVLGAAVSPEPAIR